MVEHIWTFVEDVEEKIILGYSSGTLKYRNSVYYFLILSIMLTGGCASRGNISNDAVSQPVTEQRYTLSHYNEQYPAGDVLLFLAFSGGGTRAAALSYGVLEELRDTHYPVNGQHVRLLDEVDRISSVSGGSFTSAYYGLFGDEIFSDFKDVFLYKDVQGDIKRLAFASFDALPRMFSDVSRTEVAVGYYDQYIFRGKTFADMQKAGGPFTMINASDLNSRSQFVFVQGQFDFLCSDLSQFKVARAVAASSAVPILFDPLLIKRHQDCHYQKPSWLIDAEKRAGETNDQRLQEAVNSLNYYFDKDKPPYVTLVDGGITDNLGLRSILRYIKLSGGVMQTYHYSLPKHVVFIIVNASTNSETQIGKDTLLPSITDTLIAVTGIQLHLYNRETNALLKRQLRYWTKTLSTPEQAMIPYFIELDEKDIKDPEKIAYFNKIPTSFSLQKEQVDMLIDTAKSLLREDAEYQKLLYELGATSAASAVN